MVRSRSPVEEIKFSSAGHGIEASLSEFDDSDWETLPPDLQWGNRSEVNVWLRMTVATRTDWAGDRLVLHVRPEDCEILAYVDGRRVQAFDGYHHEMIIADSIETNPVIYTIALDAYSGLPSTSSSNPYFSTAPAQNHRLAEAEIWRVESTAYKLYYDLRFLLGAYRSLDKNGRDFSELADSLAAAVDLLDFRKGETSKEFYRSASMASELLQTRIFNRGAGSFAPTLWSTGHAHIDTAWLWRLDHTRQKCQRTFSTAIEMIKRYPDYKFTCSQPQQYEYIKEDNPALFAQIKDAIASSRWETVGGMWIEADCNVTSGESLVRQFLYGQRFFEKEFGSRSDVVWLPDVFGYSAAFPQIIKKAGMKYFMTIKIFWSQINNPPYQTFLWRGLDGTDVLTHFSPLGDYNAVMNTEQLFKTWNTYKQKNLSDSVIYIYGYGDGGGGPTYEMLETAQRAKDCFVTPKVKLSTAQAFFEDLERQVSENKELPIWNGELYLEYHRGTYTTQAKNKLANRRNEVLYQTAEQLSCLNLLHTGGDYPIDELNRGWKLILLNQFHDIIPGSSIHEVYEDSARDYTVIQAIGAKAVEMAITPLARSISCEPGSVVAYNPLSWNREDIAFVPAKYGVAGQKVTSLIGEEGTLTPLAGKIGPLTITAITSKSGDAPSTLSASPTQIENKFFKIIFDGNGEICSLVDKRVGREVIDSSSYCKGNSLITFEDRPMKYEAWDIDIYYSDKPYPITNVDSITVIESGPIRAGIEIIRILRDGNESVIRQRVLIYADFPRIDFETEVDWKESKTLLKAAFPVTVNSLRATYDIQFGSIERPTHWNTSWDWARFEVCGQKWADLSEGDYGISLLSDSKYGWDIRDNVMRLTLLRSPNHPDATADIGIHHFTYSLYPHSGDWRAAKTVQRAYELNVPLKFGASDANNAPLVPSLSLVSVNLPNLIIETVKKAEDENAMIIRLYEAYNQRGEAILSFTSKVISAESVNLMESVPDGPNPVIAGNDLTFTFNPFEIKTFKVKLGVG